GAAAALVSHRPDDVDDDAALLVVDDVLTALEDLGRAARARTQAKVIGVTGSVGKTSTKEMLRTALSGQGKVHAAEKSFNNHWGVPLTLARMPRETDFAIIEIGMNHPGEIAPLSRMARPDVAIITTVAPAHLEAFSDVTAIAREKASVFEGLTSAGTAVVNADLDETPILIDAAARAGCRTFGASETADWRLDEVIATADATVCRAEHAGQTLLFKLGAPGRHFAMNGLACLAAINAAGGDLGLAAVELSHWAPPAGRGQRQFIQVDAADNRIGIDLFDDAYNANPASVSAALEVLAQADPPGLRGQRVAVLGDMKELGASEADLHRQLAGHPAMEEISVVHCVGPLMRHLHESLPAEKRGSWVETSAEFAARPSSLVQSGDTVLIKGSLSMNMALIVDAIAKLGQAVDNSHAETR
ncbi:MAG: UDP-N-acetylmuramoyl-tripeptide--D-alanyl-D-alanine ligase, partial [Litoreibacter sp.]|nr:UDP-N-acetylmuramoyl-tripeptide--D-alanyl-D-alanine ligase [Litoreibacter sp.]